MSCVMSVRPFLRLTASVRTNQHGQISVKFDTGDFYENVCIKSRARYMKTQFRFIFPATLNRHKNELLE
jgi:hypothetical protein